MNKYFNKNHYLYKNKINNFQFIQSRQVKAEIKI